MSLSSIMHAAVSGLNASQAGLAATSNNIANVNTPGYARQRVDQTTGVTAGRVSGVRVGEPVRVADRFLEMSVHRRAGAAGSAEIRATYLDRMQGLLGAPGAESGLPNRLDQIAATAVAMSAPGAANETASLFVSTVEDAIGTIQQLGRDVSGLRDDVETEVGDTVERINGLLRQIHDLNDSIARLDGLGRSVSGAADQRNEAISALGRLVDIVPRKQPSGRINIDTASGAVLLDTKLRQISYPSSGSGSLAMFPAITIRYAEPSGALGPATGETIASSAVGGKLGGLLDLRDRALPGFAEELGTLMLGLAESVNSASNAATAAPPPNLLTGRINGLVGADRLGFTGATTFAVTGPTGALVAKTTIDFAALGAGASIDDAVAAINAGLGGAATASYAGDKLVITATATANGVVVADDAANPSDRAGIGFAQFFGLNDIVRSSQHALAPTGFVGSDAHGFATGSEAGFVLRDGTGRLIASHTTPMTNGGSMDDILADLNASPMAAHGSFTMDDRGRFRFEPVASMAGATLTIATDTTNRFGTGLGFATLSGLSSRPVGLEAVHVRKEIAAAPSTLPMALFQASAAVGDVAVGFADRRGADLYIQRINTRMDLGKDGVASLPEFTARMVTGASRDASHAQSVSENATGRFDDAVNRRNSFSGVNIDEELAGMVMLQNSYSAAARVLNTAKEMYDVLVNML